MNFAPQTLLARSVLLIALVLVLAHIAWLQIFRISTLEPRARQVSQQIISSVNITRAALVSAEPAKRYALLGELAAREGVQIYLAKSDDVVTALPKSEFYELVEAELHTQLGMETQFSLSRNSVPGIWVSFEIDGESYWMLLPETYLVDDASLRWVGWGALVLLLAVAGAWLIVARINRPLKALTAAAAQMGRGSTPAPVNESGPTEIRTLSRAFNQMAADRKKLDDERALLLAGVSHDLRTPLARIRLSVEMLDDKGDTEMRAGIEQDINDIDGAINQFLDFARAASSERADADVDVNAMLEELITRYARAGKVVQFKPGTLPLLALRRLGMQRVFSNLIDNAMKHGGHEVTVMSGTENNTVFVEVLDRGAGIPPEDAERMLEPFTRMDTARSTSGTGLGLAIVDRIARMHGGSIRLRARDGGGLRARVELPTTRT